MGGGREGWREEEGGRMWWSSGGSGDEGWRAATKMGRHLSGPKDNQGGRQLSWSQGDGVAGGRAGTRPLIWFPGDQGGQERTRHKGNRRPRDIAVLVEGRRGQAADRSLVPLQQAVLESQREADAGGLPGERMVRHVIDGAPLLLRAVRPYVAAGGRAWGPGGTDCPAVLSAGSTAFLSGSCLGCTAVALREVIDGVLLDHAVRAWTRKRKMG